MKIFQNLINFKIYKFFFKKNFFLNFKKRIFPIIYNKFIYNLDIFKFKKKILVYKKIPFYFNNIKEFLIFNFLLNYNFLIKLSIYRSFFFLKLNNFKKIINKKHIRLVYLFFFSKKNFYFNLLNFNYYLFIINNFKKKIFIKDIIYDFFLKNFLLITKKSLNKKKFSYKDLIFFKKIYKIWKFSNISHNFYFNFFYIKKNYSLIFNFKKNENNINIFIHSFLFFLGLYLKIFF